MASLSCRVSSKLQAQWWLESPAAHTYHSPGNVLCSCHLKYTVEHLNRFGDRSQLPVPDRKCNREPSPKYPSRSDPANGQSILTAGCCPLLFEADEVWAQSLLVGG